MDVTHVFLVEDHPELQQSIRNMIKSIFGESVEVVVAETISEAVVLFDQHNHNIGFILMDTNLGKGVTTYDLAKRIRKRFDRLMIAISLDSDCRQAMVDYCGCDGSWDKADLYGHLKLLKKGSPVLIRSN